MFVSKYASNQSIVVPLELLINIADLVSENGARDFGGRNRRGGRSRTTLAGRNRAYSSPALDFNANQLQLVCDKGYRLPLVPSDYVDGRAKHGRGVRDSCEGQHFSVVEVQNCIAVNDIAELTDDISAGKSLDLKGNRVQFQQIDEQ